MSYPKIVAQARQAAVETGIPQVVYQNTNSHWWNHIPRYWFYDLPTFDSAKVHQYCVVRLLIVYPTGRVIQ